MVSGELCIPESQGMREGTPDAIDLATQRIAMQHDGWDVQERTLHIGHVYRNEIEINGGHMQTLLVIDTCLAQRLGKCDDHRATTDTGFVRADKLLLLYEVLGIMHEYFGHGLTDGVRREKLTGLFIMNL